ncbi:MAG: hypothetical protein IKA33_01900, partial [Candidatus Methanomethylophilaceae archaeon]|nr:hypothetical protein [Candidatus Methanomethylophilaceae archaeon]
DFVDGDRTGKGMYVWSDRTTYEGDFVDGEPEGKGRKTHPDGTVEKGIWEKGVLIKKKIFLRV